MKSLLALILFALFSFLAPKAQAITDPLSVPNNKYGIHIISATVDEASPAAAMVNNNGDWGYITVLIEEKDRNKDKWQQFFNYLRKEHLIPIVRLATKPEGAYWKRPLENEEIAWADFLDSLIWPTKNRYVVIYNEPNHAQEWGNSVDAKHYAQTLNKTIEALKKKSDDFFVINAGLDASAPQKLPAYMDEASFLKAMNEEVPGIFNKLDGWSSHSYPNPNFSASPNNTGRISVKTYLWELDYLKSLGLNKNLPVFITETGWKHNNGEKLNGLPSTDTVSNYYKEAFQNAWNNPRIVTVTPFLLNYQDPLFVNFSFTKKADTGLANSGDPQNLYHPQYFALKDAQKINGKPTQENKATLVKGEIYKTMVENHTYVVNLTLKNTGQSIWNENEGVKLVFINGGEALGAKVLEIPKDKKVEPGSDYTFTLNLKSPQSGTIKSGLTLFMGEKQFDSSLIEFQTQVKSPVALKVKTSLKWKTNSAGEYMLNIAGVINEIINKVAVGQKGESEEIEAKYIVPDYTYDFTLKKPFYKEKTISQEVHEGVNNLDFGELEPDLPSAILNPKMLWQLLPFSN